MKVGNIVKPNTNQVQLASGCSRYNCAVVVNLEPFQLMSLDGDMYWSASYQNEKHLFNVVDDTEELSRQVKQRMMKVGLLEDDRVKPTIEQLGECWEDWLKVGVYEDQRFGQYFYNRYQWKVDNSYNVERPREAYEMLWQSLL